MSDSVLESSFCKNCDNFMDITNNISSINEQIEMEGGNSVNNTINMDKLNGIQIESSDYDVSISESGVSISGGNENLSDDNINSILDGSDTEISMGKNFDISELNKNTTFNKLSNEQKTLVINRILEKNPKHKSSKSTTLTTKESYFYCKSCGYHVKIPDRKFIFSRGNENKNKITNNFINYTHDNTLPKTKKYNCINSNCPTHKNPSIKLAVFYRHLGTYNIRYICKVCNKFWDNYIET